MKVFFKTLFSFVLIAIIPLLVLLAGYIYFDPFKVLKHYDEYTYFKPVPHVIPNRDFINTAIYLNNGEKEKYNSFVFGSSRTCAFTSTSWKKHLKDSDKIFFFDASGEGIYGIYTKLKFLDEQNAKIDHALILFCRDAIFKFTKNFNTHLTIKHPATSGGNRFYFQYVFFKAYLNLKFLASFYDYTFTGQLKPFMKDYIEAGKKDMDPLANGASMLSVDNYINQDPNAYYDSRQSIFYERKGETVDSLQHIDKKIFFMLSQIKKILDKHKTDYKIILSPIYDEKKFSHSDLKTMKEFFGNRIYDFTGKNAITESKYNWYEEKHFRTFIGDSLLNVIYDSSRSANQQPGKNKK